MAGLNRNSERGGSKLKLIMTLAIMGAMVFSAVKIVPAYFANYQLQDAVETESRFALTGYPRRSADDVRQEIYKKAQELGITTKPENIRVLMDNGSVDIGLDYSVSFDLIVYQWIKDFHIHADNHTI